VLWVWKFVIFLPNTTSNNRDARTYMNTIPNQHEPTHSSSRFTLGHLFFSDVQQRRSMLKMMSARGRQMAASVFYEANQLKPRTCFRNRPLHVLLSTDESTKLALGQVNKQLYILCGTKYVHFLHDCLSFGLISLIYR